MIQRIQTVFLFLVAISMILVVVFPLWQQVNIAQTELASMDAWKFTVKVIETEEQLQTKSTFYIGILALIVAGLAIFSALQFKNRSKQMLLNMINSLLMAVMLGLVVYTTYSFNTEFNPQANGAFVLGFWAIIGGMIMNLLANRFIRKDEMLVRSVDRIR
ncbi:DUF4293 domain-containing protein [Mongoliitalea daihaiensis]|uniref:DUF4293 domain-containing protein n=1 Tax=Mongoliitalea daihaiensis TaxID=2782006 RepID=UPI001F2CD196|nr:DUF4293 domain-containing protein [Mongoliitalea daihaiensis]UJP65270.1 DUF4293 domain-containing protein [Mongoliitalea daihaiensis]